MVKKIVNLTPHDVRLFGKEEKIYPATGNVARVRTTRTVIGELDGVSVMHVEYEGVEGIPSTQDDDVVYIVSVLVAQVLHGVRDDVVVPDTSPDSVVRDEKGNILGVKN